MPRAKRNPSSGESESDWLAHGPSVRTRPWALEEELFGSGSAIASRRVLEALEAELFSEHEELARMVEELHTQAVRIAELMSRLDALTEWSSLEAASGAGGASGESLRSPAERDYHLCRCEGFEVDSPTRRVGVVEGLRYLSRIDRPDQLEVRAGPFARELLLIPVEEVDQILVDEGRLILRSTPRFRHDHLYELLARLRGRRNEGSARAA